MQQEPIQRICGVQVPRKHGIVFVLGGIVMKKEEKATAAVKPEEKAAAAVKETKKAPAKKETSAKKSTSARKAAVKETVYLQYMGKEINKDDLLKSVKEIWTKQLKKKAGDLKSVELYLKPEENRAYYVVNGDTTGELEL